MITFSFQITWGFPFMLLIKKKKTEKTTHGAIALFYVIYDCISPSCVDLNSCLSRENENAAQWKWGAGISRSLRLAIQWPAHQHVCSQETTPAFRGLMRQRSVHTPVVPEFFFYFEMFCFFSFPLNDDDLQASCGKKTNMLWCTTDVSAPARPSRLPFTLHSFWVIPLLLHLWPLKLKLKRGLRASWSGLEEASRAACGVASSLAACRSPPWVMSQLACTQAQRRMCDLCTFASQRGKLFIDSTHRMWSTEPCARGQAREVSRWVLETVNARQL